MDAQCDSESSPVHPYSHSQSSHVITGWIISKRSSVSLSPDSARYLAISDQRETMRTEESNRLLSVFHYAFSPLAGCGVPFRLLYKIEGRKGGSHNLTMISIRSFIALLLLLIPAAIAFNIVVSFVSCLKFLSCKYCQLPLLRTMVLASQCPQSSLNGRPRTDLLLDLNLSISPLVCQKRRETVRIEESPPPIDKYLLNSQSSVV